MISEAFIASLAGSFVGTGIFFLLFIQPTLNVLIRYIAKAQATADQALLRAMAKD